MSNKNIVTEWLDVIATDLRVIEKCLAGDNPELKGAAYHCQQAAEKIMKTILIMHQIKPLHTHDLAKLFALLPITPDYQKLGELIPLTQYNILYRYPMDDENSFETATLTPAHLSSYYTALNHFHAFLTQQNQAL